MSTDRVVSNKPRLLPWAEIERLCIRGEGHEAQYFYTDERVDAKTGEEYDVLVVGCPLCGWYTELHRPA